MYIEKIKFCSNQNEWIYRSNRMEKRLLLRTQKNKILQAIRQVKLNPSDFRFDEINRPEIDCIVSKLVHKPTGFYFIFSFDYRYPDRRRIEYYPTSDGKKKVEEAYEMSTIIDEVSGWLWVVKREVEAPDLWATILDERKLFEIASTPNLKNDLLNAEQQKYISVQLEEIKNHLIKIKELNIEQRHFVEDRFNYMAETLETMGIQNWIQTVIGVSITIIWTLALAPEQAKELVSLLGKVISHIVNGMILLPL
jgi:hypothetical protein